MPRLFAINNKCFPTAAKVALSLMGALLMALALPTTLQAQGPALTTISDTVYRADGTAALGTVLISWPSFQTAEGDAVAAGNLSVTIGPLGAFTAQLVPNVGASPAGTYYVVVFQLDDGTVRTEYWAVPATSPTTIAAILTTPGTGLANLAATQQYVNALDATDVHLAGTETITGTKQFTASPSLPTPVGANDAANKGYVDSAVSTVGSGAYLPLAGGTMTGPLTLPAAPAAPNQAADRQYVDSGLLVKADLVNGTVPTGELGVGVPSSTTCLTGNSTWGSCGGGAPAGISYASTAQKWSQTSTTALTGCPTGVGCATQTLTLSPCPAGLDVSGQGMYDVYLADANAESVLVTGGSTASCPSSATINFVPYFAHSSYTVESASSGIQETINIACGANSNYTQNGYCNVTVPAIGIGYVYNRFQVYGTIYFHSYQSTLSGYGVRLECYGRGPCLQIGDEVNSNHYPNDTIQGFNFATLTNYASIPAYEGVNITNTSFSSGTATVTTATAHGFRPGDLVTILFTDSSSYWGDAVVATVPTTTTFTYAHAGSPPSMNTPGVVALAYSAILDNAESTRFSNVQYDLGGENGQFNNFFDMWDDENAVIDHFTAVTRLNGNINWTSSFIFSGGQSNIGHNFAPVITLRDSSITAGDSNCATDYNSNGLYIENVVCQSTGPWQFYSSSGGGGTGNYQGAYLKNIYSESTIAANPPCTTYPTSCSSAVSPYPGTGIAGLIAGPTAVGPFDISGAGGTSGQFQTGGSGSTAYTYYIVAHDVTAGSQTSPMQVLNWESTGSDSIPVSWPRVANGTHTITYDVIRMTSPSGAVGELYPYYPGCTGGSGGACGSVATNLSQATACSGRLVCTYTDTGSSSTSSYAVANGSYTGSLSFWPGSIVTVDSSIGVDSEASNVVALGLNGAPAQITKYCGGTAAPGAYTACLSGINTVPNQAAMLLGDGGSDYGSGQTAVKGRLNFATVPGASMYPHHFVTLIDSQPGLTQATKGYRPSASSSDTWIGTDVSSAGAALSAGQLAFGSPVAITNYIANNGSTGTGWLERLSASLKEFNVPVKFDQNVTFVANLVLPSGNGYVPEVGGIGLDTAAGLPVVNIGGTTEQVALTSSNISGQAGTAVALAATPTQCSGSFATGIAANGNANCSTADVIQLAETTPPAGIPNWGVFWFDSSHHAPFFIDNDGQAVQLGLTNLFNSDPGGDPADNLEERNGSNAENLRVYSSYTTGGATWQRTSLGFDAADNPPIGYAVIRSENSTSASAPGLGFWIGSGLKWVVDSNGTLKPWTDNAFNLGSDSGNAVKSVFAKTSFNSVLYGRNDFEIPNDPVAGTGANQLAVFNTNNPSQAVLAGTSATNGVIGVVVPGSSGNSGSAVITWHGYAYCIFDNATTAGDAVSASTITAGDCHDTGSSAQPSAQLIGYVDVTDATAGATNGMRVSLQAPPGSGSGGSVASVFGRTGAVTAATGDYSVGQVTGAAVDSTVVHLAGTETITGSKTFSSNVTLNGNLNVAGNINQTGSGPTQWSGQEWTGTTVTVPSGMAFSLGVGSNNTFICQLVSGASCMPSSMVYPGAGIPNSTGSAWGTSYGTSGSGATVALTASPVFTGSPTVPGYVPTSTTVNGHALSSNVTVSASDLTTGTLSSAQLPIPTCSWITVPTESGSGNAFPGTTNKAILWGVFNPYPCVTNHIAYVVGTADNTSNNYALGLLGGSSGGTATIIASTATTAGSTFAPAAGIKTIAWNASNITVPAGRVYIALTSNCASSCAALLGTPGTGVTYAANQSVSVTTGGAALSGSITLPTDSFSSGASIPAVVVY
jgi:hypothetical protein